MERLIISKRLVIRPRTIDDIEDCIAMDCDALVTQYIDGPWHDPEKHRAFLIEKMTTLYPHPFGYWSIALIEKPDEFLGWVMLLPVDDTLFKGEIGWRLTRKTWGRGIATEATKKVIQFALEAIPQLELVASIHSENLGSIKVAEKIGMSFDHEGLIEDVLEQFYSLKVTRA